MTKNSPLERLKAKTAHNPTTDCWLWTGSLHPTGGYAQFSFGGRRYYAHRASWILHNGDVPDGLQVCHRCDVRHCVNPDHLFLGTAQDNTDDMKAKGRGYWPGPTPRPGSSNPRAVLTEDGVVRARRAWRAGKSFDQIGAELGVSRATAHLAITGRTWGHVTEEPPVGLIRGKGVAPRHPRPTRNVAGERNPRAKLTAEIAEMVRRSDKRGAALARELGVSSGAIYAIRRGATW